MPLQFDKLDLHETNSIDIQWKKANNDLSCNLSSDLHENIVFVDLNVGSNNNDPSYLPLSRDEQNKLHIKYNKTILMYKNIKKLIVIGIPHSGTTWFATNILNKHPSIEMYNEILFGWSTSYCNAHFIFNDKTRCNWNTMKSIMETFYTQKIIKSQYRYSVKNVKNNNNYNYYIGFKITLWQILPTMYGDFIRWIYCNNITVIQLIRSASINAFYSQQAEVFENLFYGREFFKTQYSKKNAINNETFDLDPHFAKKYVQAIEFWQDTLWKLLKFHKKSINVMIIYYEDLINKYSVNYLNSLQGFLNIKYDDTVFKNQRHGIARLHSLPCHVKIKNWYEKIKYELLDSFNYYACEKDNS